MLSSSLPAGATSTAPGPLPHGNRFSIDASTATGEPEVTYLQMGSTAAAVSPAGRVLGINNRYLSLDGAPWLPVMGEFHYSRCPAEFWEQEILKIKAGGIQIISTYVFWIHHEEIEGKFDWSGQRDLRRFVELCGRHGMYVWMRIGPWAHGEVRNGGLPDWLLKKSPPRVNDATYLSYTRKYYDEIGRQLHGLLWKDGGPIVGLQLENEYTNRSAEGGAAHITILKEMAVAAGFDVPVYTVTGWDNAVYPERTVTPVFGGYPDEPWAGARNELPPDTQGVYQFAPAGGNAGILQGQSLPGEQVDFRHYPRFTVELGAGMQLTYHRRVVVDPEDFPPIAITALGSGVSMLGYYMYHGGTNPDGKLSTLHESQATAYPNDVPVKSYDFQAPLREFGQLNGSYRKLKIIHQFLADFGDELAPMVRHLPALAPVDLKDTTTLRVAARTRDDQGFIFFNNYVRHHPMPEQKDVQVTLQLPSQTLVVPAKPISISSQTSFFWPVNQDLGGAFLTYATAQPFAKLADGSISYFFFVTTADIPPEFVFTASTISSLDAGSGEVSRADGRIRVSGVKPSTSTAIDLRSKNGRQVRLVLLSPAQAENAWKVRLAGRDHLLITPADVFSDHATLHLRSRDPAAFAFSILPDVAGRLTAAPVLQPAGADGLFTRYRATITVKEVHPLLEKIRAAAPSTPVKMGPPVDWRGGSVAEAPDDAAFAGAGVWQVTVPPDALSGVNDVFLEIRYAGDVGRLLAGSSLLTDNFFNGTPWEVGLKGRISEQSKGKLRLEVLPLRKDSPFYLPAGSWPDFKGGSEIAEVLSVRAISQYELTLNLAAGK